MDSYLRPYSGNAYWKMTLSRTREKIVWRWDGVRMVLVETGADNEDAIIFFKPTGFTPTGNMCGWQRRCVALCQDDQNRNCSGGQSPLTSVITR